MEFAGSTTIQKRCGSVSPPVLSRRLRMSIEKDSIWGMYPMHHLFFKAEVIPIEVIKLPIGSSRMVYSIYAIIWGILKC